MTAGKLSQGQDLSHSPVAHRRVVKSELELGAPVSRGTDGNRSLRRTLSRPFPYGTLFTPLLSSS